MIDFLEHPSENSTAADWMSGGIGAFMHFLPNPSTEISAQVEAFDCEGVARQLAEAGAAHLIFTLGQNSGYYNAPNTAYDRIVGYAPGERCAVRDLPLELAAALAPHGIRLMLYLPCQMPFRDLRAVRAFGLPDEPLDNNRILTPAFAAKWAEVIREWAQRYRDAISGWWFDGAYDSIGFGEAIASRYAVAAKSGNSRAAVAFNRGDMSVARWMAADDYTAGEINEPLEVVCSGPRVDGAQWHLLTYLGHTWGGRETRFACHQQLSAWAASVAVHGGCLTFDMGPNYDAASGPIGAFDPAQLAQLRAAVGDVKRTDP